MLSLNSKKSLITYIHIFVYELAESVPISLPFQSIVHILYLLCIYLGIYIFWGGISFIAFYNCIQLPLFLEILIQQHNQKQG